MYRVLLYQLPAKILARCASDALNLRIQDCRQVFSANGIKIVKWGLVVVHLALMMHLDAFLAEYFEHVQSGAVVDF